jgi:integrase
VFDSVPTTPVVLRADEPVLDEAQLAAAAFPSRYGGRTLESYRADLRQSSSGRRSSGCRRWRATRAHIELYRAWVEQRGLAPATVDRRRSPVCGYYRFAHPDGRIPTNPALHVRRPRVHSTTHRGMHRGELAAFLYAAERSSAMHAALAVLLGLNGLRVSEACGANVDDLGSKRGHRALRIVGKGNRPAVVPLVPRTGRTIDLAIGERTCGPMLNRPRRRSTRYPERVPLGPCHRAAGRTRPRPRAHARWTGNGGPDRVVCRRARRGRVAAASGG